MREVRLARISAVASAMNSTPAGTWLWLAYFPLSMNWMWAKLVLVAGLVGYHHVCKSLLRKFEARQNTKSHVWFRWFNEIPVIVLLVVVLLVVLKPF